jgi:two-component system response regulator
MNSNLANEILLIEDNPNDVELTVRAFAKCHYMHHIHVISDGAEAQDFFLCKGKYEDRDINAFPKLVMLDLKLPKVDGLDILRMIKADERTKMIPVVVLTSSQELRDISEGYRLGANSFIVKPGDFNKFTNIVAELSHYWLQLNNPPYYSTKH